MILARPDGGSKLIYLQWLLTQLFLTTRPKMFGTLFKDPTHEATRVQDENDFLLEEFGNLA